MKSIYLSLLSLAWLLTGCATGYHTRGFGGGYSEIITSPDSFIVTFKGNGYTSSERVLRYALLRASEMTIEHGYKYFVILSTADQTRSFNYSDTTGNVSGTGNTHLYSNCASSQYHGTASSSTFSGTIIKPGMSIRIKCFKERPQYDDVFDAEFYWNTNRDN